MFSGILLKNRNFLKWVCVVLLKEDEIALEIEPKNTILSNGYVSDKQWIDRGVYICKKIEKK